MRSQTRKLWYPLGSRRGLGPGSRRSGAKPQQGQEEAEQEPKAQQGGAGLQPAVGCAQVAQETLAAVGAHRRHTKTDALRAGADGGAALVQGMAEVHQVPCMENKAVSAGAGAWD